MKINSAGEVKVECFEDSPPFTLPETESNPPKIRRFIKCKLCKKRGKLVNGFCSEICRGRYVRDSSGRFRKFKSDNWKVRPCADCGIACCGGKRCRSCNKIYMEKGFWTPFRRERYGEFISTKMKIAKLNKELLKYRLECLYDD